jgi:hypothetical protein
MPGPAAKETVIVVHGTFAGKGADGAPRWYAPGEAFCRDLDKGLESRGSAARCWQHLPPGADHFHWDGANDWLSRFKAAARLREELRRLHQQGWTVHLVGHSHGGNLIIEAITTRVGRVEPSFSGRVTLLGTPIFRDAAAFSKRQTTLARRWSVASLVGWILLALLAARDVDVLAAFALHGSTEGWAATVGLVLGVAAMVLLVRLVRSVGSSYFWFRKSFGPTGVRKSEERRSPAFMLINSSSDEAYRSLSGLPQGANPFIAADQRSTAARPGSRFGSHLAAVSESGRKRLSTLVAKTLATERTGALTAVGVAVVLALLLWRPVLASVATGPLSAAGVSLGFWVVVTAGAVAACFFDRFVFLPGIALLEGVSTMWRALVGLATLTFDVQIRNSVWGFVKSLGLGLSGAPRRVEDITVKRMFETSDAEDCVYLELPKEVVDGVMEAQKTRLAEIHQILYRKAASWSPTHLREELEAVDFPLVHTTYYREPECIQKIADWLCEPVVIELDGRVKFSTTRSVGEGYGGFQNAVREEVEGRNAYRDHVEELKQKHGPPGSKWGTATNVDRWAFAR